MTNLILLEKINNIEVLCDPGMCLTYSAALYFKEGKSIQEVSIPHNEIAESSGEFVLNNNLKDGHIPSENKVIFSAGLPGAGKTTIAKALGTEVKDLMKVNETNEPLEVVFRGELTNRKSKRAFESVLFAIEDYVTMKQVD